MKKILLGCLLLVGVSSLSFAESSEVIDTKIRVYGNISEPTYIYAYYVPLNEISSVHKVDYEKNPIVLKATESYSIPAKKGYYFYIHHIQGGSKYTHFSTCHNFMAITQNQSSSLIEVDFYQNSEIGYCGSFPAPD